MTVYSHLKVDYKKKYAIKNNQKLTTVLDPSSFTHFQEGIKDTLVWKWIHLPMQAHGKVLNKLVLQNNSTSPLNLAILIQYVMEADSEVPLVYYSPSREGIIMFDGNDYRIFGGISFQSKGDQFSTVPVDIDQWGGNAVIQFQPLSKQSKGWCLEFNVDLQPGSTSYLYEWEFKSKTLNEIEELHSQYQRLLGT